MENDYQALKRHLFRIIGDAMCDNTDAETNHVLILEREGLEDLYWEIADRIMRAFDIECKEENAKNEGGDHKE